MYKLVLEKSPESHLSDEVKTFGSEEIFISDVKDIAESIRDIVGNAVSIDGNNLYFESDKSIDDLNDLFKPIFLHYFAEHGGRVRYKSLTKP